ncbi:BGLU43 [Acrasis kona]|uniref:BGLU43 n=1 Tax=Acrasis kona TaxID=1008807 RepID=A0AAW2ZP94_9EUKA
MFKKLLTKLRRMRAYLSKAPQCASCGLSNLKRGSLFIVPVSNWSIDDTIQTPVKIERPEFTEEEIRRMKWATIRYNETYVQRRALKLNCGLWVKPSATQSRT